MFGNCCSSGRGLSSSSAAMGWLIWLRATHSTVNELWFKVYTLVKKKEGKNKKKPFEVSGDSKELGEIFGYG